MRQRRPSVPLQKHKKRLRAPTELFCVWGKSLPAKIGLNLLHPPGLGHVERTAAVAVAALNAVPGVLVQMGVVVPGQLVSRPGQVVVFVDEAHVQTRRAGLAVVAVDAHPGGVHGGEGRIVPLLRRGVQEPQQPVQVLPVPHAGQDGEDAGLVQGVLDALVLGEGTAEGGGAGVQQLSAAEGLHHRDAYPIRLAPAVEGGALLRPADGVVPVVVVVAWVDAEHEQVQNPQVQHPVHHAGGVGAQADVPHRPLPLELLDVVQHASICHLLQVGLLVQAVEKAKVDVVGLEGGELPVDGTLDGVQVCGPAVAPAVVIGAEVDLEIDLVPDPGHGLPVDGEGGRIRRGQVKEVDAPLQGQFHRGLDLPLPGHADGAGPQAQNADLFLPVGKFPVFHNMSLLSGSGR